MPRKELTPSWLEPRTRPPMTRTTGSMSPSNQARPCAELETDSHAVGAATCRATQRRPSWMVVLGACKPAPRPGEGSGIDLRGHPCVADTLPRGAVDDHPCGARFVGMGLEDGSRCRVIGGARREMWLPLRRPVLFTARGEEVVCPIPSEATISRPTSRHWALVVVTIPLLELVCVCDGQGQAVHSFQLLDLGKRRRGERSLSFERVQRYALDQVAQGYVEVLGHTLKDFQKVPFDSHSGLGPIDCYHGVMVTDPHQGRPVRGASAVLQKAVSINYHFLD